MEFWEVYFENPLRLLPPLSSSSLMLDIKPRASYKLGVIIYIYLGYEGLIKSG